MMDDLYLLGWFFVGIGLGWIIAEARSKIRLPFARVISFKVREDSYREVISLGLGFTTWARLPYRETLDADLNELRSIDFLGDPEVCRRYKAFIRGIDDGKGKEQLTVLYEQMIDAMRADLGIEKIWPNESD